jgi:Rps23 Pro-64 3,4-dihydroxylase Tpa1-like proline 4-hydroxylase
MLNLNYSFKKENTIISVKDFFNAEFVEKIELELKQVDKKWWYISMYPANDNLIKQDYECNDEVYKNPTFLEQKEFNKFWFNMGNFSYMFKRSIDNHYDLCYCVMCNLRKYFDSPEVKDELSKIVGERVTHLNETFCSKYENDDYLSIHHDKGNGDYAFVFQLTKDWNPSYGGLLHFYDGATREVYKTVNPVFNSLTIFKIKNVPNTDHFVSMNVSSHARYAFAGWFSVSDQ